MLLKGHFPITKADFLLGCGQRERTKGADPAEAFFIPTPDPLASVRTGVPRLSVDACFFNSIEHHAITSFLTVTLSNKDRTTVRRCGFRDVNQWKNFLLPPVNFLFYMLNKFLLSSSIS